MGWGGDEIRGDVRHCKMREGRSLMRGSGVCTVTIVRDLYHLNVEIYSNLEEDCGQD